jgi:hypothetical protein
VKLKELLENGVLKMMTLRTSKRHGEIEMSNKDKALRSIGLVPCPKGCGNYTYPNVDECTKCMVKKLKGEES